MKQLSTKSSLNRHQKICPVLQTLIQTNLKKKVEDLTNELAHLNHKYVEELAITESLCADKLAHLNGQMNQLKHDHAEQLTHLTQKYENIVADLKQDNVQLKARIDALENDAKHREELFQLEKQLAFTEGKASQTEPQLDRFQAHILKENSKPRMTNNITNNLAPYPSSPTFGSRICKQYTSEHFLAGPESTHEFLRDKMLTDEEGRRLLACTDIARGIFKGKTEDGTEIVDVGGKRLQKDFINPLKKTIKNTSRTLESEGDWDEEELEAKTVSHMRALAHKPLIKRLAGELR